MNYFEDYITTFCENLKTKKILFIKKEDVEFDLKIEEKRISYNFKYDKNLTKLVAKDIKKLEEHLKKIDGEEKKDFTEIIKFVSIQNEFLSKKIFENSYQKRRNYIFDKINDKIEFNGKIKRKEKKEVFLVFFEKINVIEIDSLSTYFKKIGELKKENDELFFRGQININWSSVPSIYRKKGYIENEEEMYKKFISNFPNEFDNCKSTFERLTKMQHYGLPTRLVDITENSLIALYFACEEDNENKENNKEAGEVNIFDVKKESIKFYDSDTISVISNLCKINRDYKFIDEKDIIKFNSDDNTKKYVHEIREEKSYFLDKINPIHLEGVFFVKPKLNNIRIARQMGNFIIVGLNSLTEIKGKMDNFKKYDNFLLKNDNKEVKIIIYPQNKRKILEELAKINISEATIYPEIDKMSKDLKKKYYY